MKISKQDIWMIYPNTEKFSGQTSATLEILKSFTNSDKWKLIPLNYPSWKRKGKSRVYNFLSFVFRLFAFWFKLLNFAFQKNAIIYINHTQSLASFVRMGFPHLVVSKFNRSAKFIVSLHGHIFMEWKEGEFNYKVFKALMNN